MDKPLKIQAAADDKPAKVSGVAYNGGKLSIYGWEDPVVVDIAGMETGADETPLLADHFGYADNRLGLVTVSIAGGRAIEVSGSIVSETDRAKEIVLQGKKGADWQLSIGATANAVQHVKEGARTINGQDHAAPFFHISKSTLCEVSVVPIGADQQTHMTIAASLIKTQTDQGVVAMPPTKPAEAAKIEAAKQEAAKVEAEKIEAAKKEAEKIEAAKIEAALIEAARQRTDSAPDIAALIAKATADERTRVAAIKAICAGDCPEIEATAIADGQTPEQVSPLALAALRASRPNIAGINVGAGSANGPEVLQAAAMSAFGIDEKARLADCGEKAVEAAGKQYRHGLGLQQMIVQAALANGCQHGDFRNYHREILQAAFSSASLPGILSNVANKRLLASFDAVEQVWRQISAIGQTPDFKAMSSYRLTGDQGFLEVAPDGELKHGTLGEESYSNQAKTYGRLMVLTRQMQINDDMGALASMFQRLGRGAALKVNDVFWTAFMDNAAFFAAGNSNYMDGATTALDIDALTAGNLLFRKQTDPDGSPMAVLAKYLLTPVDLEVTARKLMVDTTVIATDFAASASTVATSGNPHVGKHTPIASAYLNDSTTAWYLLADPMDVPVIETVFLNGVERPTVESAAADFNTLGIQFRGYFDFGVAKQEYRGGIKSKGAAA